MRYRLEIFEDKARVRAWTTADFVTNIAADDEDIYREASARSEVPIKFGPAVDCDDRPLAGHLAVNLGAVPDIGEAKVRLIDAVREVRAEASSSPTP